MTEQADRIAQAVLAVPGSRPCTPACLVRWAPTCLAAGSRGASRSRRDRCPRQPGVRCPGPRAAAAIRRTLQALTALPSTSRWKTWCRRPRRAPTGLGRFALDHVTRQPRDRNGPPPAAPPRVPFIPTRAATPAPSLPR